MSDVPPLSIVIPSHARPDLLNDCLQSVRSYAPVGTQVIVVDDGSSSSSVSRVANKFGVQTIRFEFRRGFCKSANAGIAVSRAAVVQLLNDDAQLSSSVEPALKAFEDCSVAAVAPLILRWPGRTIDSAGDCYDRGGFARPRGRGELPTGLWLSECAVDAVSACAGYYRRKAILEAGGFDESFGAYFEDVDLSLRLRRAGFVIRYVPHCLVIHHGSSSYGGRPRAHLIAQQSKNEERLFWRHAPWSAEVMIRHIAVLAAKSFRRCREGTFLPWLRGRLSAWRMTYRDYLPRPAHPNTASDICSAIPVVRRNCR